MNGGLLIGLVIILSGLIAYLGDQIGMKAGKKRLSIFGLRPRYSSIIITVVTGILIAGLSITILLVTYSGLRQALFNINQVLNRLDNLNEQLEERDAELEARRLEIEEKTAELSELQDSKNELEEELSVTREELDRAEQSLSEARDDIERLEVERQELNSLVEELRDERDNLEFTIRELNQDIAELEERYDLLRQDAELLGSLYSTYSDLYSSYRGENLVYQKGDVIHSDVLEGGRSERETIAAIEEFLNEADQKASRRPIRVDDETGMALRLREEEIFNIARVMYNMEEGRRVIVRLVARVNVSPGDWLLADFMNLIEDRVVFESGEKIAAKIIDATLSPEEIEEHLQELLNQISEQAVHQGLLNDGERDVGTLDFTEYYRLLNRIDDREELVEVGVYASEDIWRQDTLGSSNLTFEIKRKENE